MINKQTFIAILIIVLLMLGSFCKCEKDSEKESENFEINLNRSTSMNCDNQPLNSNCICESEQTKQRIFGDFPMNYGQTSPYIYTCVNKNNVEPKTSLW
jgi:hypothetical protein